MRPLVADRCFSPGDICALKSEDSAAQLLRLLFALGTMGETQEAGRLGAYCQMCVRR